MGDQTTVTAWAVFLAAVLTDNILLANFLGMCPFLSLSRQRATAVGMAAAVTFVLACTTVINYLLYYHVLVPYGAEH
ncbi:MAG: Rnf-Nqr domain containing protein, partial [Planctomycetota bacterium]